MEVLQPSQEHIIQVLMKKNPALDEQKLRTAVAFIAEAHKGQFRKSGKRSQTEQNLSV